jgi:hypothetical protein
MKAVEPKGDARPEWDFLHDLVYNVTGKNGFRDHRRLVQPDGEGGAGVQRPDVGRWATRGDGPVVRLSSR